MSELSNIIIQLASITGGTFAGFLVGKRKYQKEVESITIDNVEKAIRVYQTMIEDLKNWQLALSIRVGKLETELRDCKEDRQTALDDVIRRQK